MYAEIVNGTATGIVSERPAPGGTWVPLVPWDGEFDPAYQSKSYIMVGEVVIESVGQTLDQAKLRRWSEIKSIRTSVEFGTFTCNGNVFDGDQTAQPRIIGAVQLANMAIATSQPFSVDWTLHDNSVVTLSATDMVAVGQALATNVVYAHTVGRSLRAAIEAAVTVAEVQAVQWPT